VALIAVACGSSGRDLRTPASNAISPTRSSAPASGSTTTRAAAGGTSVGTSVGTSGGTVAPIGDLMITSPSFVANAPLPAPFTCDGPSPELRWTGVPTGTSQLVLAVIDVDAQDAVQWLVTGVAPTDGSVGSGTTPAGATALTNSFDRAGWNGPCPPAGSTHRYDFVVLALPAPITIPGTTPARDAFQQMRQAAGGREAALTATVTR
jgi:Raf kinase inhibitor-like YbhB/YbcL family protein